MKMIATRTFLLKQVEGENGKPKDVIARKGEVVDVTEKEAKQFASDLAKLPDAKKS